MLYVSDDLHPVRLFLLVAEAPEGANFRKKKSLKILSSETVCFMKLILCIHVPGISLYIDFFFRSSQIRTLVAMATFSLHRLIMGKVEIGYNSTVAVKSGELCGPRASGSYF